MLVLSSKVNLLVLEIVDLLGLEIVVQGLYWFACGLQVFFSGFLKRDWLERRRRSGTELRDHFLCLRIAFSVLATFGLIILIL